MIRSLANPAAHPGLRLGLFLAAIALLPGVLALIAAGAGGGAASGLAIAEATGAFSVAALQGLERKAPDMPTGQPALVAVEPVFTPLFERADLLCELAPSATRPADALARLLPLRL